MTERDLLARVLWPKPLHEAMLQDCRRAAMSMGSICTSPTYVALPESHDMRNGFCRCRYCNVLGDTPKCDHCGAPR